jgi:hypothetical protein
MHIYDNISHLAQYFLEWEMFQTKVVEKIRSVHLAVYVYKRRLCNTQSNTTNYFFIINIGR